MAEENSRPPREDLVRALPASCELRSTGKEPPKLVGHFASFDEWAEIDSVFEGHFMERIAPGAFAKTISENRDRMKVLFHHGQDPQIGSKPLGPIVELREDDVGAYYEVDLLDTSYNAELLPGLRAGVYGSSFRFRVVNDKIVQRPQRSEHNPDGLPERTITEAHVREFGPTPWPAYVGASSGARSLTDELAVRQLADDPARLAQLLSESGIREDEDSRLYRRCAEYVGDAVWAIHPPALATILEIIGERRLGYKPTKEEIEERIGIRKDEPTAPPESAVAVLNLFGPIVPRAGVFSDISGATSVEGFRAEFNQALASADVGAILINVDSPGGVAYLVAELASDIIAARGAKPIVAIANPFAASAAYHIASAADELVVTPSGEVGSIGAVTAHDDISGLQEKAGVKTTLVHSLNAPYKVEGNQYEPLTDEAKTEMQRRIDAFAKMFVADVAKGRGVTVKTVEADFGQGRLVMAQDAVAVGMADRVATFDQTLARLTKEAEKTVAAARAAEQGEPGPSVAATRDDEKPEPPGATTSAASDAEPEPPVVTTPTHRPRLDGAPRKEYRLP